MRNLRITLLCLSVAVPCLSAWAGQAYEGWDLVNSDAREDIVVYARKAESGLVEFRGVTRARSPLAAFVALFEDVDNMPNWVDRTERVEVLERVSETEVIARTVNSAPWPLKQREVVVRSRIEQDPQTLAVTISGQGEPGYLPEDEQYVRVPTMVSLWRFTPQPDGEVEVVFQGYADPGGSVPTAVYNWLARNMLWSTPYRTLKGLKEWIGRPEYRESRISFITEPARAG
jgi:hypothetical protein